MAEAAKGESYCFLLPAFLLWLSFLLHHSHMMFSCHGTTAPLGALVIRAGGVNMEESTLFELQLVFDHCAPAAAAPHCLKRV